jgi:hypothetical protein
VLAEAVAYTGNEVSFDSATAIVRKLGVVARQVG